MFSTTDPTLIGRVADDGGVNNIAYVAFSPTGDTTFNQPGDFRIDALSLDPTGNFSVTLPNPVLGLNTVTMEVVDRAGNVTMGQPVDFVYQGPSVTNWQALGLAASAPPIRASSTPRSPAASTASSWIRKIRPATPI